MTPKRKPGLGIRRIVAGTLIMVCLGINALGFLYVSREHRLIEEVVSRLTDEHGQFWAQACVEPMSVNDTALVQSIVDAIAASADVNHALVAGSDGLVIAEHGCARAEATDDSTST